MTDHTRGLGWLRDAIADRVGVCEGWLMDVDDVLPGVAVLVLALLHVLAAAATLALLVGVCVIGAWLL